MAPTLVILLQLLEAILPTNVLRKDGPGNLQGLGQPAVRDPAQPADGPQDRGVHDVLLVVDRVLPHPEPRALQHDHDARLLARRGAALELLVALQLALHAEDGLADPRGLDVLAVAHRRQPAHVPLARTVRRVDAGRVGGLDEALADDVDGALAALEEVPERVLGLLDAAGEAEHEQRRVVVDHVEVAEGRQVGRRAVRARRAHEADRPRHDARDQQLVVERRRAPGLVRVDGDVLGVRWVQLVGAAAELPVRVRRLGVVEGGILVPVRARRLDLLEVWVRVALDLSLGGRGDRHGVGSELRCGAVGYEGRQRGREGVEWWGFDGCSSADKVGRCLEEWHQDVDWVSIRAGLIETPSRSAYYSITNRDRMS